MNKDDAIRIFNQPHDRFNMDMAALRAIVLDLIERVNKLEEGKGKDNGRKRSRA